MKSRNHKCNLAIFGFVASDEVTLRKLRQQNPNLHITGYITDANASFAKLCDETHVGNTEIQRACEHINDQAYDLVLLTNPLSIRSCSSILEDKGIDFVGSLSKHLEFESKKGFLYECIKQNAAMLPEAKFITDLTRSQFTGNQQQRSVLKYLGDYARLDSDHPSLRTRIIDEDQSYEDIKRFVDASVEETGACLLQKFVLGEEFSSNLLIDEHLNVVCLGNCRCYKRQLNCNRGDMTDGIGSISIGGTLPFLTEVDQEKIKGFAREFIANVNSRLKRNFKGVINVDAIKEPSGNLKVLEINMRSPGAHCLSAPLSALQSEFLDLLIRCKNGELGDQQPQFGDETTIIVANHPHYYPGPTPEVMTRITIPKYPDENIDLISTWVNQVEESANSRVLDLHSNPGIWVQVKAKSATRAREIGYRYMLNSSLSALRRRSDIGLEFVEL